MNTFHDNRFGRYSRTLEEAFGPHTSRHLDIPEERLCYFRALTPKSPVVRVLVLAIAIALLAAATPFVFA